MTLQRPERTMHHAHRRAGTLQTMAAQMLSVALGTVTRLGLVFTMMQRRLKATFQLQPR
jgi:hypothetical protein